MKHRGLMTARQLRTDPDARRKVERMVRERGLGWTARRLRVADSTLQYWRQHNLVDISTRDLKARGRKPIVKGFEFPARIRQKVEPLAHAVGYDSWPPLFELDESYWRAFDGR